jgi:hypothetical protein
VDSYTFKGQFDPILLPGEQATLQTSSNILTVQCIAVGALPEYRQDFGALTAATWDTDNEWTGLEMNDWELGQYRMRVMDDFQLRFNNLSSVRQWRTNKADFYLYKWPIDSGDEILQDWIWKSSEFFVWEDDTPRFDLYSQTAKTKAVVSFNGYRIRVKKIADGQQAAKVIWVSGWPSGSGGR